MVFEANAAEMQVISLIQKYRGEEYALLRLTFTMIDKNNLDANDFFRSLLQQWGLVDYDDLKHGGQYGVSYSSIFIHHGWSDEAVLKFYRVANARGDRRFSLSTIKRRMNDGQLHVGDLLYLSIYVKEDGQPQIFIANLTNDTPSEQDIINTVGLDAISSLMLDLRPKLAEILSGRYYDNSKGPGALAPKDVGDTLEYILGIGTNNRDDADLSGLIEVKSKGESRTLDTLFTLRPRFEDTRIALLVPNDKNRVKAFPRLYGYESPKHPGELSLYITIGSSAHPQNNQGFYLDVDYENLTVNLIWKDPSTGEKEIAAFWLFDDLQQQLYQKHPATLWFKARTRENGSTVQFCYTEIQFSRSPNFSTFLSLIEDGIITYDWRGHTPPAGGAGGKNHGNAWRIKPEYKSQLFGNIENITL